MKRFFPNNQAQVESMAMFYASRYEVSRKKLQDYLKRKFEKCPELDQWIESAIQKCEKALAVQDERVRDMMTESLRRRGKGNRAIQQKLKSWGLNPDLKNEAFSEDDEFLRAITWVEKFRSRGLTDQKIIGRLSSRGFQSATIFKALRKGTHAGHLEDESKD